jgi:hypothetical protein
MMQWKFCILILIFVFISCGKSKFPDYEDHSPFERERQNGGFYHGFLKILNPQFAGKIKASYVLWIKDVQFYAGVKVHNAPPEVRYQQYIHSGARCPARSDDLNGDGLIDFSEVLQSSGKILVPLDGSLKSQREGSEWFPVTTVRGKYSYSRAAAVYHLMEDLRSSDPYMRNDMIKLGPSENLDLNRRTIIIYGSESDPLLPVFCAEIGNF